MNKNYEVLDKELVNEAKIEEFDSGYGVLVAECSCCHKKIGLYGMNAEEREKYDLYAFLGRSMGYIQDIFPDVPAWIRSACIDQFSGGFCICPECCDVGAEPEYEDSDDLLDPTELF